MAKDDIPQVPPEVVDEDAPGPPISVPDSGETGEGGKLKMIVQLVKKCLGVKDIASMRLSLPASLLEPVPNLEYWNYLDRPDIFAAINDSDDPFERMLAVIRFAFTKDLKFINGGVCKPYNSVLGEHFRAHWDVPPVAYTDDAPRAPTPRIYTASNPTATPEIPIPSLVSDSSSIKSGRSSKSTRSGLSLRSKAKTPSTAATSLLEPNLAAQMSNLSLGDGITDINPPENLRVVFLTEQVSHHPPISAFVASCPSRHLELSGIDQIAAKVSGTTLRVSPGEYNQGLFIKLTGGHGEGEVYNVTHPVASVNGILRGSFYVTVGDSTIITCTGGRPGRKFRTIMEYKEESWLGKAHFLIEGVVHTVNEGETQYEQWTKVKQVPQSHVVAVFDGTWRGHVRWRRVGLGSYKAATSSAASSPTPSHTPLPAPSMKAAAVSRADVSNTGDGEYMTLIDLSRLQVVPKSVRSLEKQLPYESRKLWEKVTDKLIKKEFSDATKEKVVIEQRQRDIAAERKRSGVEFVPQYFEKDISSGIPTLTPEGLKAIEEELAEEVSFCIEGSEDAELTS
ncbi:hypothetical protein BDN72DRAFT_791897 [Pluteus cervinus]|uniref:Uncharacterized protein n=1 Tax=Pluteus cervinus TaxID=181527 RepID=A0ACD3B588_9AGAR|nr:hypothetical protein BDN72DRAFT_791897 [Pluteus cervinus]